MADGSSQSINDLLGGKKEQESTNPDVLPEKSEVAPAPEPAPDVQPESPKTLAENIRGKEKELAHSGEAPQPTPQSRHQADDGQAVAAPGPVVTAADLSNIKGLPQEKQVEVLTKMVLTDGLDKAIAVIRRLNNPYLYDLLHDTLTNELYQKLKGPRVK